MSKMLCYNLYNIETKQPFKGAHLRCLHSDNMTIAYWQFDSGARLPEHSHHYEQITSVMGGSFELTVGGNSLNLQAGSVVVIPPDTLHSARAITGCFVIDVFHPVREDYKDN